MSVFEPVLTSINLDAIPALALAARKLNIDPATTIVDCKVLSPPLFGSYNILFPLEFTDGVRWVLKVPSTGYRERFDDIGTRAIIAEASTMRMLKSRTSIPIPEVYKFDASIANELNCPFILMDFIEGVPLSKLWFNQTSTTEKKPLEQFRATVLMDLATAMVQLRKYTFDEGGSPLFDEKGNLTGFGPAKVADLPTILDRLRKDNSDQSVVFYESGPWIHPKEFFLDMMNHHQPLQDKFGKGILKLLGLFIDWMPYTDNGRMKSQFVLAHPDYSLQNILVSKDGKLCGLVDWDGVAAVPRCVGCERYPNWLTTDWDPNRYTYDATRPECMDHSLEELAIWRKTYARSIEAALQTQDVGFGKLGEENEQSKDPISYVETTRLSLLAETLSMAAKDPMSTDDIMSSLFARITHITALDRDEVSPNTEQQEVFNTRVYDNHDSNTEATKEVEGNLVDATEMRNSDPWGCQSQETADGLVTPSSNNNDSLPYVNTGKDKDGTSRMALIQKALSYIIELLHKKDTDQAQTRRNWGISFSCSRSTNLGDLQNLAELGPDVLERDIYRVLEENWGLAGWSAERHDIAWSKLRQVFGERQVQESQVAEDNAPPVPITADPSQEPKTSSANPFENPPTKTAVDETYGQGFILWDIVQALADDVLDGARMQQLKQGFDAIVASLQQREKYEGYQYLVDQVQEEEL